MKFIATPLESAFILEIHPYEDERGFFGRSFCRDEFTAHGLNPEIAQCSVSFNKWRGTLRGMHYQAAPFVEAKLVRCTSGAIHDVIVDLRVESATYKRWFAVELTAANRRMLYVPESFAHGFQTLADDTEVFYQISESYQPEYSRGIRWNDPAFEICWPIEERVMSERDQNFPDFEA